MDLNYIIMVHTEPKHFNRLIRALNDTDVHFYIHVDKGADINSFRDEVKDLPNIKFMTDEFRENSSWGDFTFLRAILNSIREVVKHSKNGYITILSGQDYPIKSKKYVKDFYHKNNGSHFMEVNALPYAGWREFGMNRLLKYKVNLSHKRGHFFLYPSIYEKSFYSFELFLNFIRLSLRGNFSYLSKIIRRRKIPSYVKPYGGSDWWSMPVVTVNEMLSFLDEHPDYLKYFEDSLLASEMFFQTILMSLPLKDSKPRDIKPAVTYANWTRPGVITPPVLFVESDFEELMSQEHCLFARKFSQKVDVKILDLLDKVNQK